MATAPLAGPNGSVSGAPALLGRKESAEVGGRAVGGGSEQGRGGQWEKRPPQPRLHSGGWEAHEYYEYSDDSKSIDDLCQVQSHCQYAFRRTARTGTQQASGVAPTPPYAAKKVVQSVKVLSSSICISRI